MGGGKKDSGAGQAAQAQSQIQQQYLNFAKQAYGQSMTAWQPSANYWTALLQGGQPAMNAVGPSAQMVRSSGDAATRQIISTLPAGGERNLAVAQSALQKYGQLSNLYSGVQPAAATALGQLAGMPLSTANTLYQTGGPNVGAQMQYGAQQSQQTGGALQGAGELAYTLAKAAMGGI